MILFGISSDSIGEINSVFKQYVAINEVLIFGSRAKGNYRDNSDIDLVIKGENISLSILQEIENKLEELYLPNVIDLLRYDSIQSDDLKDHINRVGKVFYTKRKI